MANSAGHIFISYSRQDSDTMHRVCAALDAAGFVCWTDEKLTPGTPSWKNAIERAIEDAACMVVLLSPDAKQSAWIEREIDYSQLQNLPIFPVLVRGDARDSIPFELINVQYTDLSANFRAGVEQLAGAIQTALASNPSPARVVMPHAVPLTPDDSQLEPWNLLDQFRLFAALFFTPERLREWDAASVKRTGFWLVSTLAWLPLALAVISFFMGAMTLPTESYPNSLRITASVGLSMIVGWAFAGWMGRWRGSGSSISLLSALIAGGMAFAMFAILGYFNVTFGHTGTLASAARTISLGTASAIAYAVAFAAAPHAAGIPSGILLSAVLYGAVSGNTAGRAGGIGGALLIAFTIDVSLTLRHNLKHGRLNWRGWLVGAAVVLHYLALLWFYFLGGWNLLLGFPM